MSGQRSNWPQDQDCTMLEDEKRRVLDLRARAREYVLQRTETWDNYVSSLRHVGQRAASPTALVPATLCSARHTAPPHTRPPALTHDIEGPRSALPFFDQANIPLPPPHWAEGEVDRVSPFGVIQEPPPARGLGLHSPPTRETPDIDRRVGLWWLLRPRDDDAGSADGDALFGSAVEFPLLGL